MSSERLIYLPLGGAGEIGMNAYVYGYGEPGKERLILVDLGVTFPDMDTTPGVDLIHADISWLQDRADRLAAIKKLHRQSVAGFQRVRVSRRDEFERQSQRPVFAGGVANTQKQLRVAGIEFADVRRRLAALPVQRDDMVETDLADIVFIFGQRVVCL